MQLLHPLGNLVLKVYLVPHLCLGIIPLVRKHGKLY